MTDAPRYRLVGYDIGTAPDENGGWVHWTDHEAIVARLTAERDAALAGAVKVKPLVWDPWWFCGQDAFYADAPTGNWAAVQYSSRNGRWAYDDPNGDVSDEDWETASLAQAAAQADYKARIIAAIQPAPEAHQAALAKAFCMGRDMSAETADDCRRSALAGMGMGPVLDAIRALTPPADLAAKIGGE